LGRQGCGHLTLRSAGARARIGAQQESAHKSSPALDNQLRVLAGGQPEALDIPDLADPADRPRTPAGGWPCMP
jgi:hypothetical protein